MNKLVNINYEIGKRRSHLINLNYTKCDTWKKVKSSHEIEVNEVVVHFDEIFGIMILLGAGLAGAFILLSVEYFAKHTNKKLALIRYYYNQCSLI